MRHTSLLIGGTILCQPEKVWAAFPRLRGEMMMMKESRQEVSVLIQKDVQGGTEDSRGGITVTYIQMGGVAVRSPLEARLWLCFWHKQRERGEGMMRVLFVATMQRLWKSLQDTGPKKVHHLEASEGEPAGDSQVLDHANKPVYRFMAKPKQSDLPVISSSSLKWSWHDKSGAESRASTQMELQAVWAVAALVSLFFHAVSLLLVSRCWRCLSCHSHGYKTCSVCLGSQNLLHFIQLTVTWYQNHAITQNVPTALRMTSLFQLFVYFFKSVGRTTSVSSFPTASPTFLTRSLRRCREMLSSSMRVCW